MRLSCCASNTVATPIGPFDRARGSLVDCELAQFGPVVLRDVLADDPWSFAQVARQLPPRGLEMPGPDVRGPGIGIGERLDEDVLGGVVQAA